MPRTLAVIGAGFSGTATAIAVLRSHAAPGTRVLLFEQRPPFGPGLAYGSRGSRDDRLLLNVPAGNMSMFPDAPDHFAAYCAARDPAWSAASFVPRYVYGDYLVHTLDQATGASRVALERIADAVVDLRRADGGFELVLAGGAPRHADRVVLAPGHFPPRPALAPDDAAFVANPWDLAALDRIAPGRPVLLLGSGHTAVDVALRLCERPDTGPLILLSRRGLLPHMHRPAAGAPPHEDLPPAVEQAIARGTTRGLLHELRAWARAREDGGGDWRDTLNALRPHLPRIWAQLAPAERRRFLARLRSYWDIHRHRLAPEAANALQELQRQGRVSTLAGRLLACTPSAGGLRCTVLPRGGGAPLALDVGAVVDCTGPSYDLAGTPSPLLARLHAAGWLQADALGLGLQVDADYAPIGTGGQPVAGLYYIGPQLRALYWEAIAVPELRVHAQQLAERLLRAH